MPPCVRSDEVAKFFVGVVLRPGQLFFDHPVVAQRPAKAAHVLDAFDHRRKIRVAPFLEIVEIDIGRDREDRKSAVERFRCGCACGPLTPPTSCSRVSASDRARSLGNSRENRQAATCRTNRGLCRRRRNNAQVRARLRWSCRRRTDPGRSTPVYCGSSGEKVAPRKNGQGRFSRLTTPIS